MAGLIPLIAIVGPTAVGKTALAVDLARHCDGEIINADSRQLYVGMDIGTAKPTSAEQAAARHHLIDLREPDAPFSLGEYLPLARTAIREIAGRGRVPILCGGSGQYVWALLEGWQAPATPPDRRMRAQLERRAEVVGSQSLWQELRAIDPQRAAIIHPNNRRRVIRALEICSTAGPAVPPQRKTPTQWRPLVIGLTADRAALYARIDARVDQMMDFGLLREAQQLAAAGYSLGEGPLSGVGYRELGQYLAGELSLADAVTRMKTQTHRLARRQYTWFKPVDPRIHWLDATHSLPVAAARRLATAFLESPALCDTIAPYWARLVPAQENR